MYQIKTMGIIENARAVFESLKEQDGNQAAFLQAVAAEFGKPVAIQIRMDGKTFRRGEFRSAQDYPDFPQRLQASLRRLKRG